MKKFANTRKGNRESGYGLIFAALGLVVLLGAAGLSVDMGYLRYQRRLMQSATDSAALAGAAQLGAGAGFAAAQFAAMSDSQLNGFKDGDKIDGGVVSVTPTQTTINGNANTMQVQITNKYQTFFMRALGNSFQNVTVSTVATAQYLGGRGCIYALTGGGGINVTGAVDVPNCNVLSNEGIRGGGSITAAAIGVHTNSSIGGTPAVITGVQQTSDPLSYLPAPADPGGKCPQINYDSKDNKAGAQTILPGKYCGISFANSYSQNVTFSQGDYYITGGLSFAGTGHVKGTGVFFYIASGAVSFTNQQRIRLVAPTNGARPGILIFQPVSNTNAATVDGSNNGKGSYLEGALYFPNAALTVNGAASAAKNGNLNYMLLVANTLNLNTSVDFPSDYASLPNGYSPVRTTVLVQ